MRQRNPELVLDDLGRPDFGPWLPQPALDPVDYARGHDAFEARSDQRSLVIDWVDARIARHDAPSVLAVGCGTGAVDAPLAARACARAAGSATVRWTGVDPHPPSAQAFADTLDVLGEEDLQVRSHACTFASLHTDDTYDVITFVQSLYYVDDVAAALTSALALLNPGGELLLLHAPLGALNELAAALAPDDGRHRQWWSDTVLQALRDLPVTVEVTELDAVLDLTGCDTADAALLDFTVQAALTEEVRPVVLAALRRAALPGPGLRVPHPVTAFRVLRD